LTRTALPFAATLFLVACGRPVATSSVAPSRLSPPEAFQCVMKTFQVLGFQRTMYDQDELRASVRRENPKITFSNTQFRKTWDRVDVDVGAGTAGTDIDIVTATEAEYFSQNGKNLRQLTPSPEVQEAARELRTRCGESAPITADSVPASADSVPAPADSVPQQ
jgi:hypothetical protein